MRGFLPVGTTHRGTHRAILLCWSPPRALLLPRAAAQLGQLRLVPSISTLSTTECWSLHQQSSSAEEDTIKTEQKRTRSNFQGRSQPQACELGTRWIEKPQGQWGCRDQRQLRCPNKPSQRADIAPRLHPREEMSNYAEQHHPKDVPFSPERARQHARDGAAVTRMTMV